MLDHNHVLIKGWQVLSAHGHLH